MTTKKVTPRSGEGYIKEPVRKELIERIKSYEWRWHIEGDIRRYDYFEEKLAEIGKVIKANKIIRQIGADLIKGKEAELLRIACYCEFDYEDSGFMPFYEDSHTGGKWYIKIN